MSQNTIIIIPARLASTRLPNKPLADIHGLPMVLRVYDKAMATNLGEVVVACSEIEVYDIVKAHGGLAVMTNPDLPSGTDRIYAALTTLAEHQNISYIINLQGDVPSIRKEDIAKVLEPLATYDMATLATKINNEDELLNPNIVKLVKDQHNRALYFSRNPIPYGVSPLQAWHHIGIYAYKHNVLQQFVTTPPSFLEQCEKLEQLRALEHGINIGVAEIAHAPRGVDTLDDLEYIRKNWEETT